MPSLTNTNASDNATTSTPISNNTLAPRQDSAQPRLILHLNAKQRKEAEAAARSLQSAGAALERYRWRLDGRSAPESWFTQPLLHSAHAAIETFNSISHPGHRARREFDAAKRRFDETSRLMARDIERLLERELRAQREAEREEVFDLPLRLRRSS